MSSKALKLIFRFILLLILQILICNHIYLFGFLNPNIYLLALLLLPLDLPLSVQYIIAFFTGLVVDAFQMTFGIHASAALLMVAVRPYIILALNVNKKQLATEVPLPGRRDFKWLLSYTLLLVFVHQTLTTMLELWSFHRFGITLLTIMGNTLFTTLIILCAEYLCFPSKTNN
ncbi:MAG: hypothetical protein IJT04_09385 [Bacteroidales bacterium]|nr:hypothetical protein [Bacteroidales bacterium]